MQVWLLGRGHFIRVQIPPFTLYIHTYIYVYYMCVYHLCVCVSIVNESVHVFVYVVPFVYMQVFTIA